MDDIWYNAAVVLASAVCFHGFSILVSLFFTPTDLAAWKWKNTFVSFVHSCLSGTWAMYCFYDHPAMAEDLHTTYSVLAQNLVAMSVGYFVYDAVDMIRHPAKGVFELLLHHCVIFICFGVALVTQRYIGYAVVGLIVELNNVFLHLRQLLQQLDFGRTDYLYRFNSLVNIATFILIRVATIAWMTRWIFVNKVRLPFTLYCIGTIGLAVINVMNIVLFYRLLKSDFMYKKHHRSALINDKRLVK